MTGGRAGPSLLGRGLLTLLRGYRRWISPAFPPTCRFYPSCSAYAVEAITVHGAGWGVWLTVRRLLRCAPWHPGGMDPVPPRRSRSRLDPPSDDPHGNDPHGHLHGHDPRSVTGSVQDHEEQAPC